MRASAKKGRTGRRGFGLLTGAFGAALAYFLDPDRGRARRAKTKDQLAATFRRTGDRLGRRARYAGGKAQGYGYRLSGGTDSAPEDDHTLEQKVQSEVLGKEPWRGAAVNVMVSDGVVELHGEVRTPDDIKSLEAQVRTVTGVRDVANFLHLPGTPAPNKQDARRAS